MDPSAAEQGTSASGGVPEESSLKRWGILLLPILIGLAASTPLLVDDLRPMPVFCGFDQACGAVRRTLQAALFGIPTPALGVGGFLVLAVLTLLRGKMARLALLVSSAIGSAVAAFLLWVQHSMGTYCPYCVAVDVSAIVVLALAAWRFRAGWDPPSSLRVRAMGAAAAALAVLVPVIVGLSLSPVPRVIAEEMERTPPGKVTIIDFVDFECPFCRETHAELHPVLDAHRDKIRLVRKHVPLTRIHPHALEAARAACCGEALGKGDEFADALFSAPLDELTTEGCEKIATRLGIDLEGYRACLRDPKTDARIKADSEAFRASGGHGLPTLWINKQKLEGAQDRATLEAAAKSALDDA